MTTNQSIEIFSKTYDLEKVTGHHVKVSASAYYTTNGQIMHMPLTWAYKDTTATSDCDKVLTLRSQTSLPITLRFTITGATWSNSPFPTSWNPSLAQDQFEASQEMTFKYLKKTHRGPFSLIFITPDGNTRTFDPDVEVIPDHNNN